MFSQYFGNYLFEHGKLTKAQFVTCMEYMRANRVKLGLIAEAEGLLTRAQANELNRLQRQSDKRFGDLAVEKGYLTEGDITNLLHMQGNPYLIFVQALQENQILSREEIEIFLEEYQREEHLSNTEMAAMKVGNLDDLLPTFVPVEDPLCSALYGLALRNVVRFISSLIRFEGLEKLDSYEADAIVIQKTEGVHSGFLGFGCDDDAILTIADSYAGEFFDEVDEDSLDAVGEFVNCINGLFATELSYRNIAIDMLPPEYFFEGEITSENDFYMLPLYISGRRVDLLVGNDCTLN